MMHKTIALNEQNLNIVGETVLVPAYDRSHIKTSIVHVGIGGFHRAHFASYTEELLQTDTHNEWGICGIALLPFDTKIYRVLQQQNGLYTLMIKEFGGDLNVKVIGALTEYLFAPNNPTVVIEKMSLPDTKIISLTITEGGYNYDEATGVFNFDNPDIQYDLNNPDTPKTIYGYLAQALQLRKTKSSGGLTIQSCDNIQGNGDLTKKMVLSYLEKVDSDLVAWVKDNVTFPNSMVDRITPVTTEKDIELLRERTGILDAWPVTCEPFRQWIIEDNFVTGRPNWEKVGAKFVKDVAPYEYMKLRLLNAGHSVLGILGALIGYDTIDEAVADDELRSFLRGFMDKEATPSLENLEDIDLEKYKTSLIERFGNQNIKDQVSRICSESSAKIPIFILPTLRYQLRNKGNIKHLSFVIAAWAIYSLGVNEKGIPLNIIESSKEEINAKALKSQEEPKLFLEVKQVFGDLKDSKKFSESFTEAYRNIAKKGIKKCVKEINANN